MSSTPARTSVRLRAAIAVLAGATVTAAVWPLLGPAAAILSGWGSFALITVVWVLRVIWPMDAEMTREHATLEAPGRRLARLISIIGSVVSLSAVLAVIVQTHSTPQVTDYLLAAFAVLSVAASWALIQVEYVLRYARMYYAQPEGGIDFNQTGAPEYTDFVYFSVGLGMTYQVADTSVTRNDFRRVVISQTLLAYLFGTVILASIINLVVGLG